MKTDHLPSPLQIAAAMLTPEQIAARILKMTPRKFALLLVQHVSPRHVLRDPDTALLHGVCEKTWRRMRHNNELP